MKRSMKQAPGVIALLALVAIAGCGERGQKYDTNLLTNASFEKVGSDGIPTGWKLVPFRGGEGQSEVQYGLDNAVKQEGAQSWFFRADPGTRRFYLLSQEIPVAEGTTHVRLQGWLQTDAAELKQDQFAQSNFLLTFYDKDHNRFQEMRVADKRTPLRFGTNPWMEESFTFRVPQGTRFVTVSCVLGMNGQTWFDNVNLSIPKPAEWEITTTRNFAFHTLPGHPLPQGAADAQQQIFDYMAKQLNLQSTVVIDYYVYPDTATIQEMLSLKGHEYVSWDDREFHSINPNENHEIVHFMTDAIGRPPRAIAEGTVFCLHDEWDGRPLDDCVRDLVSAGMLPRLTSLFDYNTLAMADPNITMPAAGSFIKFLLQRWGPGKLMELYAATNGVNSYDAVASAVEQVYGMKLEDVEAAWHAVLNVRQAGAGGK